MYDLTLPGIEPELQVGPARAAIRGSPDPLRPRRPAASAAWAFSSRLANSHQLVEHLDERFGVVDIQDDRQLGI